MVNSPPTSSPTFSVRPRSSVGRVTVDLIRRSWVRFPPRSKDFFFTSCGYLIPFTRANAQWVIHGFISTLIYTSELTLCFTICVLSATRHNIHMSFILPCFNLRPVKLIMFIFLSQIFYVLIQVSIFSKLYLHSRCLLHVKRTVV